MPILDVIQEAKDSLMSFFAGVPISTKKAPSTTFPVSRETIERIAPPQQKPIASSDPLSQALTFLTRDVFVRYPLRAAKSLEQTISAPLRQKAGEDIEKQFIPGEQAGRTRGVSPATELALFGPEPIERFGREAEEKKGISKLPGLALAGLALGIDITPFGGPGKNLYKQIAKETVTEKIVPLVKQVLKGVADDEVDVLARRLTTISDPKAVEEVFKEAVQTEESVRKFLKNAYKVYDRQKPYEVVARLSEDVARRTDLPKDVIVKQAFFDKMTVSHPEIPKERLFNFVRTVNVPDEIYKLPEAERLNFFRKLEDETVNLVSTKKDFDLPQSNVVTSFTIDPTKRGRDRYILNIKKTGEPVFERFPEGRPAPSSLPEGEAGGLSALRESLERIDETAEKVKGGLSRGEIEVISGFPTKKGGGITLGRFSSEEEAQKFLASAKKDFPEAYTIRATPQGKAGRLGGAPGAESRFLSEPLATPSRTREEIPQIKGISPTPEAPAPSKLDVRTLPEIVSQEPHLGNAIQKTAREVGDQPSLSARVVESIKEIKTRVIQYWQNTEERVRQLVQRKDVKVSDVSDPYLKATLYPGRVATKVQEGYAQSKTIVDDMASLAKETKATSKEIRKEVNDYLHFQHAPERNAVLGDGAAGVTTAEAKVGLERIVKSPQGAKVKQIAEKVLELNKQTLDLLRRAGVIDSDLYATLRAKYKHHVPLQRIFEQTEDIGAVLSGRGFDVRSTGLKRAVGSKREVEDILTNVVTNYEQAVLRSEKNIVDQATLAFVRDNEKELGGLFEIIRPKAIGKTFDENIILERTTDPTILQMFENGKRIWIKINDPQLAVALRGVGREKLGTLLNAIGKFTRLYSGLATRFNPEFALPNKIRDLQETIVYLTSQKEIGFVGAARTATKDPKSIKGVTDAIRGIGSEGARLYNEMKSLGGTTGGFGLSTRSQVELNFEKLEKLANSKTRRTINNLIEYVDYWNTIFEDSTRLSVYRQALESGLSKDRAAFLAKEASINFNRMGKGGPVINALWMFSNASIQGSVKMIRSLKNPKVLMATVVTVGGAVAAVNEWNDVVDPEWRDKVSKWDRLNGLPIVIPTMDGGVKYITIPVSWGLKPIKVMTEYAYDALSGEEISVENAINDAMISALEAYNPIGGADLVSALSPTFLDVPSEIARNRAWHGNKIRPDFDPNAPADIQYFDSLGKTKIGQAAISVSELLRDNANIIISPADIKYAYDGYVGGAGRTVSKTLNTIFGFFTGQIPPPDEYPIISRFYREQTKEEVGSRAGGQTQEIKDILEEQSRGRFDLKREAELLDKELLRLPPHEANARASRAKEENPDVYEKLKDVVEERKLGLTYAEKLMKQLGVENGERAKYIHEQILKLPKEKRQAYYEELRSKKIISREVARQMAKLQNQ